MVAQWGFANEALGKAPVAWETPEGNTWNTPKSSSEQTEMEIDVQVKAIVSKAFATTMKTLTENRLFLDKMAEKLVEDETLDYTQLEVMRDQYGKKPAMAAA